MKKRINLTVDEEAYNEIKRDLERTGFTMSGVVNGGMHAMLDLKRRVESNAELKQTLDELGDIDAFNYNQMKRMTELMQDWYISQIQVWAKHLARSNPNSEIAKTNNEFPELDIIKMMTPEQIEKAREQTSRWQMILSQEEERRSAQASSER